MTNTIKITCQDLLNGKLDKLNLTLTKFIRIRNGSWHVEAENRPEYLDTENQSTKKA